MINQRGHWLLLRGGWGGGVTECTVCLGSWPFNIFFSVLFLFHLVGVLWPQLSSVKTCAPGQQRPFPPVSLQRQVVCGCGLCSCGHLRGQPVSSYFSMAYYSVVFHWCKWCMLLCSQCASILVPTYEKVRRDCRGLVAAMASVCTLCVQILSLCSTRWPVFPTCIQLILVSWYVASMLCCHCWMFSLSDTLPMQSYPSKEWVLCRCGRADLCAA